MADCKNGYGMKTKISPNVPSGASCTDQSFDVGHGDRLVKYRNLLVPIDFSEHSKKTVEYAMQLASFTGARIKILHVSQMPENPAALYEGIYVDPDSLQSSLENARREANQKLLLVTEQIHAKGVDAQPILRAGNPQEEIVSVANEMDADLIVIGSHGHGGLGRLLLGSTAERVLHNSPCAVLVVKGAHGELGCRRDCRGLPRQD
jgi:nucleotide-binding universal stress UspA family protein